MSIKTAIIGSGNIGTDLMIKIVRNSQTLEVSAMVGIDPQSEGLARAEKFGVAKTHDGVEGLLRMPEFQDIKIIFDATSAAAHYRNNDILQSYRKQIIDLTPAAIGPYLVPVVNMDVHVSTPNLNMVSCGGQATVPIVAAVRQVVPVHYAEIISTIASKSAGPGTRANIDEFTQTTARAIETVGGAAKGKAIIILNPAEPPIIMRNTVFCLSEDDSDSTLIIRSVEAMIEKVRRYVPGYRLKQEVQVDEIEKGSPLQIPGLGKFSGMKTSVFLEVEGAGHYLPSFAGNLDIMTSAAIQTAECLAQSRSYQQRVQ
jgi:acetaldehyde dehydrogenase